MLSFFDSIGLARTHNDEAKIRGQRRIVRVNRVKREFMPGREFNDFGTYVGEVPAQRVMLGLGGIEIGSVVEAEITPTRRVFLPIPSGRAG